MEHILSINNVFKKFGGLQALNDVSLEVNKGEIFALIGPNGAGKTTLFNVVAGVYKATSGEVLFRGKDITRLSPNRRCKLGITRTFQITRPFHNMTVLENVMIGSIFGASEHSHMLSFRAMHKSEHEAIEVLKFLGLDHKAYVQAGTLNVPERKRLELCRALATKPDLLMLDEVIAGLNPSEVGGMVELIREINATGVTILMIEHIMKAVMSVSERIAVLNFGKIIARCTPDDIMEHHEVVEAYIGKRREAALV